MCPGFRRLVELMQAWRLPDDAYVMVVLAVVPGIVALYSRRRGSAFPARHWRASIRRNNMRP